MDMEIRNLSGILHVSCKHQEKPMESDIISPILQRKVHCLSLHSSKWWYKLNFQGAPTGPNVV